MRPFLEFPLHQMITTTFCLSKNKSSTNNGIALNMPTIGKAKPLESISSITHISTHQETRLNQVLPPMSPLSSYKHIDHSHQQSPLSWVPKLTAPEVWWYLLISTLTIKWPSKQPPQNMLSTTNQTTSNKSFQVHNNSEDKEPDTINTIICWATISNIIKTVYIYLAGKFSQIYFCCIWLNSNAIIVYPLSHRETATIVNTFNPYATSWTRNNTNLNFVSWTMKHHK